jgi:hypothetical protein
VAVVQDWQCKAPIKLCEKSVAGQLEHEGQEVVVLSKVGLPTTTPAAPSPRRL